jgi:hypothetical protein
VEEREKWTPLKQLVALEGLALLRILRLLNLAVEEVVAVEHLLNLLVLLRERQLNNISDYGQ